MIYMSDLGHICVAVLGYTVRDIYKRRRSLEHEVSLAITVARGSIQRKKAQVPSITVSKMGSNSEINGGRANHTSSGIPIALCEKQPLMAAAFVQGMVPEYGVGCSE
ncbi:hypothetical protein AC579_8409 [Pseudocercospora musae]|uniref:Uncharacterized protein n=1 Tax=Pseudocercospora musae TaxID=113226 RepID=A0A139IIB4_9PEZI|nr:hypothetical protein AC579_8409 [Pseudocercospora musae]